MSWTVDQPADPPGPEPAESPVGPVAAFVDRALIGVTGPDATSFLQGQVSQDVAAIPVGGSAWSFVLEPQGKVDGWVRLHRIGPDEVLVEVDAAWAEHVAARLGRFKLRVDCEIGPAQATRCLEVRGVGAGSLVAPSGLLVAPSVWPGEPGVDLVGSDPEVPAGTTLDPAAVERRRVLAGVPRMGREFDDTVIPAEAGPWLVEVSASFTKGCYVGQELVARVESRGSNTPRRLRGVRWSGRLRPGDELLDGDGKVVGRVTSVAEDLPGSASGSVGLAFVARSVEVPGVALLGGSDAVDLFEVPVSG